MSTHHAENLDAVSDQFLLNISSEGTIFSKLHTEISVLRTEGDKER
jgi:hypothetical protein